MAPRLSFDEDGPEGVGWGGGGAPGVPVSVRRVGEVRSVCTGSGVTPSPGGFAVGESVPPVLGARYPS